MKKLSVFFLALLISLICSPALFSQNISTEGKDFWLGFMENHETSKIDLEIFISARDSTNGVVAMPYYSWSMPFTAYPGSTAKVTVPTQYGMNRNSGEIADKGIHISAENDVSVYALNKRSRSSDATVVLPSISLGKEYFAMAHMEPSGGGPSLFSEILIVAVTDSTELQIVPSSRTTDGKLPDVPFLIKLNKGQTYQLQSENDLTGTKIEILNSEQGDCKNFAVFGGNEWTRVGGCRGAQDNLFEQMFPVNTWGKEFISVPYKTRLTGDILKIMAAEDSTTITINESEEFMLHAGRFYSINASATSYIKSDKPISIGQFSKSQSCDNVEADPFFIMLSPLEQRLKKVTFNALDIHVVDRYYLNLVVPTDGVSKTFLDGLNIADSFKTADIFPEFAFAQIDIEAGDHTIECGDGFIAYVYGYGDIESFGYATGVSLQNLNLVIESSEPGSDFAIRKDSTCIGEPVVFSVNADSSFIYFDWDFGDGNYSTGKTVTHSFDREGIYPVKVTANTSTGVCSSQETSIKYIYVVKPRVEIYGPRSVCPNVTQIEYRAIGDKRNTYEWFVDGGLITSDTKSKNITVDWGATNSDAFVKILPRNYLGCYGDTLLLNIKINVKLEPSAPFGEDSLCSDLAGEIEYEAYLANGSIYDWHSDIGEIVQGQGDHIVDISWETAGIGKLWFEESSTLDDICAGWSDTLTVFIERAPVEDIVVNVPDELYYGRDSIPILIEADPSFAYYSWDFGDGHVIDSIPRNDDTVHVYSCNGNYMLNINAYTGTVCRNLGSGSVQVEINRPILEMLYVSNDTATSSGLEIDWTYEGSKEYQQPVSLWKSQVSPMITSWKTIEVFDKRTTTYIDQEADADSIVYAYKVETNYNCKDTVRSLVHNNVKLQAIEVEADSSTQISWNEYINWGEGIRQYEIWRKVDNGAYEIIDQSNSTDLIYPYEYDGFDYCYRIKAVENGGNNEISWSNEACVDFVPQVKAYNFFTPNDDEYNQFLNFDRIELYQNSILTIYNRYGQKIREFQNYQNNWDAKVNGSLVPAGTYYYYLELNEPRNNVKEMRGYFTVMY